MTRQMQFGYLVQGVGGTSEGWRHPDVDPRASISLTHYIEHAKLAEQGLFSFLFIADGLYIGANSVPHFINRFEPLTLLSVLSTVTHHVGLVATVSSSFNEPFTNARQFLSLDRLSNGRSGWNLVTSPHEGAAHNHSMRELPSHDERYRIAQEHLDVVKGLWDSWEDDAFVYNKETGQFFDRDKLHKLDHKGRYYEVEGPLNIARSPQGYPVVFQAGSSPAGRQFAAKNADAIFTHAYTIEEARDFYADMKRRAAEEGKNPDELLIFPDFTPIVGDTEEEAQRLYEQFADLTPIEQALKFMSQFFDHFDFTPFDLDGPFPDLPEVGKNGFQGTTERLKKKAREHNLTLRQVARDFAVQRSLIVGTPEQVADYLQEWFESGAADGFIFREEFPHMARKFVDSVVPVLQARGLYRNEYQGTTLRDNLGLRKPANVHSVMKDQ